MNFQAIEKKLRTFFEKEKIIFGGSTVTGNAHKYSDIDVYIVIENLLQFKRISKDKKRIFELKQKINRSLNIHIMPKILLDLGLYHVEGIYFKNGDKKNFLIKGNDKICRLNSLKLCLKHLIKYKLCEQQHQAEKHFMSMQKKYFFLTGQKEDDLREIENKLETEVKKAPDFIWSDWLFYCMRFRRIFPRKFEKNIINCLISLKRYIDSGRQGYVDDFYDNCSQIEKGLVETDDTQKMFATIDNYVFLIFVI